MSASPILCIAGKNRVAVDTLDLALAKGQRRIVALPNGDDDGVDGWQPSFRAAASARDVPIVDLDWAERQGELCFLSVEFDRLIRPGRFANDRLFNVHFSWLPRHRGCFTAIWPILCGDERHGVTLHRIDSGMDTGAIIDSRDFAIANMTARDLYMRCMDETVPLVDHWLPILLDGDVPSRAQDETQATSHRRADLDFGWADVDPLGTVEQALRTVRAFHFPEYQLATFGGRRILDARRCVSGGDEVAGTLTELADGRARLALADGAVELEFAG